MGAEKQQADAAMPALEEMPRDSGAGGKNKAESGSKRGGNRQIVVAKRTSGEEGRRLRRRTEEGKGRA